MKCKNRILSWSTNINILCCFLCFYCSVACLTLYVLVHKLATLCSIYEYSYNYRKDLIIQAKKRKLSWNFCVLTPIEDLFFNTDEDCCWSVLVDAKMWFLRKYFLMSGNFAKKFVFSGNSALHKRIGKLVLSGNFEFLTTWNYTHMDPTPPIHPLILSCTK